MNPLTLEDRTRLCALSENQWVDAGLLIAAVFKTPYGQVSLFHTFTDSQPHPKQMAESPIVNFWMYHKSVHGGFMPSIIHSDLADLDPRWTGSVTYYDGKTSRFAPDMPLDDALRILARLYGFSL